LNNFTDCVLDVCTNATHIDVEQIIIHKDYDHNTHANDIGLIRLKTNVNYSQYIQPICLPSAVEMEPSRDSDVLEICGWGANEQQSRSEIKQALFVPHFNHAACQQKYHDYNISESQLCAGGMRRKDSCAGDSGGPLLKPVKKSYTIEGILSFGIVSCGSEGWPSVYTRVSSFEPWIRENVRP